MSVIGTFGPLIFRHSSRVSTSYSQLDRESHGRWGVHDTINARPLTQFIARGQRTITMDVTFTRMRGVNPDTWRRRAEIMAVNGNHHPLILSGRPATNSRWYIESVNATDTKFAPRRGEVLWCECQIVFKEYR